MPCAGDGATARVDHAWQEAAIEPDRGEQIGVELLVPVVLAQGGEAAGWCCGASEVVDEDVDAAHAIECFGDGAAGTLRGREVGGDEQLGVDVLRLASRGDEHDRARCREAPGDRRAGALRAAADERTATVEVSCGSLYRRYTQVVSLL